jgi:hypothetical protein
MIFIKHYECLYCDIKNPIRSFDRDRVKDIDVYQVRTIDEAKEVILQVISKYGAIESLSPKILSNSQGKMWIECDRPFRTAEANGCIDIKTLALEITTLHRELVDSEETSFEATLRRVELSLGPAFHL